MDVRILIVDDEPDMLTLLTRIFEKEPSYSIDATSDPRKALNLISKNVYHVVITDLKMPNIDGMQVLEAAKTRDENTAVIILTAYGTIESAVEATKKGAFDYVTKPFRKDRIIHVVQQAVRWREMWLENLRLRQELLEKAGYPSLIGNSQAIALVREQITKVAKTSATVLITGESGTGKELVAKAIHAHSTRHDKPFIPINCSAIPESLLESELFGYVKGAFTGATKDKKGLIEEAQGGTLFLDEIGDLSPTLQVKLLRLLQEGEYRPIGSNTIKKADVRYIAATNRDLKEKIEKGEFREDLFYRLNVFNIHIPPLRERREDIELLAYHFLSRYASVHGKPIKGFNQEAVKRLLAHSWPGNVRELENTIERGVIMATSELITPSDLFPEYNHQAPGPLNIPTDPTIFDLPFKEAKGKLLDEFQLRYLQRLLEKHNGNISQTARECGLKRQHIYRLLKKIKFDPESNK
ncbi:MAG: sigma-54 dependent transcriptional regulator [Syntrophobacterales bacterium]|nr:sigma-54 dependent transcriptional regulator [Syntrophobacterales bacterium]